MLAWRIYDHGAAHARVPGYDPLGGAGGLHRPARWHHRGHPILYAASTPSLAVLEVLVHETSESFRERTILQIELEEDTETISPQRLVRLLADAPPHSPEKLTRDFGTQWLEEARSLALIVPSIVMPYENNVIINPLHHRAKDAVRVLRAEVMSLDHRLVYALGTRQ